MSSPQSPTPTSTSGQTAQKEATTYIDPAADVELVSADGRVFRVHGYVLLAHRLTLSAYFRAHPSTKTLRVPADRKTLKLVLDLLHRKPLPPAFVASMHQPALALASELGLDAVADRVLLDMLAALGPGASREPWAVFKVASQRDAVGVARAALKVMDEHAAHAAHAGHAGHAAHAAHAAHANGHADGADTPKKKPAAAIGSVAELSPKDVDGVSPAYLLGLYRAALELAAEAATDGPVNGAHAHGHANARKVAGGAGPHTHGPAISWAAIASRFEPVA